MSPTTFRNQIAEAFAQDAPDASDAAAIACRVAAFRRRSRRRRAAWLVAVAAVLVLAFVGVLVERPRLPAQEAVLGAAEPWLGFRPILPSEEGPWTLIGLRAETIAGSPGVRLDLLDADGLPVSVLQVRLPVSRDPAAPAGTGASKAPPDALVELRVELGGITMTARPEHGLLVAACRRAESDGSGGLVRRPHSAVVVTSRAAALEEDNMTSSATHLATLRLARASLAALALSAVPAMSAPEPAPEAATLLPEQQEAPRLLAVKLHADWCPACRKMGTIFDELAAELADEPVQFVELDFTDDGTRRQSGYLAAALGLDEALRTHGRAVGIVLLVDARTKRVVGQLDGSRSLDELAAEARRELPQY